MLTQLHAGGKFGGGGYKVSGGLHGVGISVVNALSSRLDVEVRQKGHVFRMSFGDGVPDGPLAQEEGRPDETGTTITFWPNAEIFETRRLRLRDAPRALPADGLPQQGPDDQPRRRAGRARRADDDDDIDLDDATRRSTSRTVEDDDGTTRPTPSKKTVTAKRSPTATTTASSTTSTTSTASKRSEPVHPEVISIEVEDTDRSLALELAMQWTNAYSESVHTYANSDQHPRGRHPRGGLPRGDDQARSTTSRATEDSSRRRTRTSPATTSARASPPSSRSSSASRSSRARPRPSSATPRSRASCSGP